MIRILIGHLDFELPPYDTTRFDVRGVRHTQGGRALPSTIAEMLAECPAGWKPDVYYHAGLIHFPIPSDIEDFDGLTVTHIQDWHRGGRAVWAAAGFFDLIATERNACALLEAVGYRNAVFARYWGVDPRVHRIIPGVARDIDVLFIGSLNSAVWEERNRWVERLARLSERYRVVIATGHFGEDYVRFTNRAKIVFNRSVNGCTNQRAYDGLTCGALVFNEEENTETREIYEDRVHCVYYNDENFEALLEHYLAHEDEREKIVEQGRQLTLARHTETVHTNALFALFEANLDKRGYRPNASLSFAERTMRKALQIYCCALPASADTALRMLNEIQLEDYSPARVQEAGAALLGWVGHYVPDEGKIKFLTEGEVFARQASRSAPENALTQMTHAFLLLERADVTKGAHPTGRNDVAEAVVMLSTAAELVEKGLSGESDPDFADIEGFGYPRWNDSFDSAVERAYLLRGVDDGEWARAMRRAVSWRCRLMLSNLAEANGQVEEACRQASLGARFQRNHAESLLRVAHFEARLGQLESAVDHYRQGIAISPFAMNSWPELALVLKAMGRREEAEAFVGDCLRIVRAAPMFAAIKAALNEALA